MTQSKRLKEVDAQHRELMKQAKEHDKRMSHLIKIQKAGTITEEESAELERMLENGNEIIEKLFKLAQQIKI